MAAGLTNEEREMIRSLRNVSTPALKVKRRDFENKVLENIHTDSSAEVGRSSNTSLLQDPARMLDIICSILKDRGELDAETDANRRMSTKSNSMRILFRRGVYR